MMTADECRTEVKQRRAVKSARFRTAERKVITAAYAGRSHTFALVNPYTTGHLKSDGFRVYSILGLALITW